MFQWPSGSSDDASRISVLSDDDRVPLEIGDIHAGRIGIRKRAKAAGEGPRRTPFFAQDEQRGSIILEDEQVDLPIVIDVERLMAAGTAVTPGRATESTSPHFRGLNEPDGSRVTARSSKLVFARLDS